MDKFIQLGNTIIAIKHIVAIKLDVSCGTSGDLRAVKLWTTGSDEAWTFYHGTPEATALTNWAQMALHTTRLVALDAPKSSQSE